MKIFISWSGETSHLVACALRDWLPYVIQTVKPFISSGDIHKGERWSDVLGKELEDTKFGIICLTPYNIKSPWLNFEAGALSKSIDHSFLSPFLFQIPSSAVKGPVSQFQFTIYEEKDVFNLLTCINNKLEPEVKLEIDILKGTFDVWWPKLKGKLDELIDGPEVETKTGYPWLHTRSEIENIEKHTKFNKIWVITPSPELDLNDLSSLKRVKENISKGIEYTVIYPINDRTVNVEERFKKDFMESEHPIIKKVPSEKFQNLAVKHFLVLNPESASNDPDTPLRVFFELPIEESDYWIEVDKKSASKFADRFVGMQNEAIKDEAE